MRYVCDLITRLELYDRLRPSSWSISGYPGCCGLVQNFGWNVNARTECEVQIQFSFRFNTPFGINRVRTPRSAAPSHKPSPHLSLTSSSVLGAVEYNISIKSSTFDKIEPALLWKGHLLGPQQSAVDDSDKVDVAIDQVDVVIEGTLNTLPTHKPHPKPIYI